MLSGPVWFYPCLLNYGACLTTEGPLHLPLPKQGVDCCLQRGVSLLFILACINQEKQSQSSWTVLRAAGWAVLVVLLNQSTLACLNWCNMLKQRPTSKWTLASCFHLTVYVQSRRSQLLNVDYGLYPHWYASYIGVSLADCWPFAVKYYQYEGRPLMV